MNDTHTHHPRPTHEEIEACASIIFIHDGRPEGRAFDQWLQAELQLLACRLHEAGAGGVSEAEDTG